MTVEKLFNRMTASDNLFTGKYDAKNGSKEFMHGVSTVMEEIALSISEETYEEFSKKFLKNMLDSQARV